MMEHMQAVHDRPRDMTIIAKMSDPDTLARWCIEETAPMLALCSIISRAHWTLVNGHWCRKQEDGVRL